jgi:3',5'-cyclic AMP phosphodiesterase CpdA
MTGDLTEDGVDAQFEVLAEVLAGSRIPPEKITMVPGNHDVYADPTAWSRALDGPLRPYAPTCTLSSTISLRDAVIVPVSTLIRQHWTRSAGAIERMELDRLERLCRGGRFQGRAVIVAQHHPPYSHPFRFMQWIDGLQNPQGIGGLLRRFPDLHVVHGHMHRLLDRSFDLNGAARAFCGEAVVAGDRPLRLYQVQGGAMLPIANREVVTVGSGSDLR